MTVLYRKSYDNVDVTDVEVCGQYVFVSVSNQTDLSQGFVDVYITYNRTTKTLELYGSVIGEHP